MLPSSTTEGIQNLLKINLKLYPTILSFKVLTFFWDLKLSLGFWILSWKTSLLCIVGELAGGRSVAVAVGVGDR